MIYLDNAATSWPKPDQIWQEVLHVGKKMGANPGRAGHQMAMDANRVVYNTRVKIAKLINAPDPLRIIFTLNATDALNVAMFGLVEPGDHVLTTSLEHNAVVRPLALLAKRGVDVEYLTGDELGRISETELSKAIRPNTKLFVFSHASNVTGTIQDSERLSKVAREAGVLTLLDSAQTIGVFPLDVKEWQLDMVAFPGHKGLLGPQGTGGLYVGERANIKPWRVGGSGSLSEQETHPLTFPDRLEAGTPNTPGIAGLGAGLDFISAVGREKIQKHEVELTEMLLEGLEQIPRVKTYGVPLGQERAAVVSFTIEGSEVAQIGFILDKVFNIAVRTGLHCAPVAHRKNGTFESGTVRVSPGYFTTQEDIRTCLKAIAEVAQGLA